jgi:hypothetical protein
MSTLYKSTGFNLTTNTLQQYIPAQQKQKLL